MPNTVIDTCCLINVATADDVAVILPQTGLSWHIPAAVAAEGIFIRSIGADGRILKESIDLAAAVRAKVVLPATLAHGKETEAFIELAAELDDGEAMGLAIASCRGWSIATDDRKARRIASDLHVNMLTTPEVMRLWAANGCIGEDLVRSALKRIETLAKFVPSEDFPEAAWWRSKVGAL